MIALRTLTSYHVVSMFPPKLFGFSITQTTDVSVVHEVTLANRQDTRRLRFSFFLQRCQTAGRIASPNLRNRTRNPAVPLVGGTGSFEPAAYDAHRDVGATERCASLSDGRYMREDSEVSSISSQKIYNAGNLLKTRGFSRYPWPETGPSRDCLTG